MLSSLMSSSKNIDFDMIFVINVYPIVSSKDVKDFLLQTFHLSENDVNELLIENNVDAKINYEITIREQNVELRTEICFFLSNEDCLELGIYNDLYMALLFNKFFNLPVVINDGSEDPYRWLLIEQEGRIYLVDEKIGTDDDFSIDYDSKHKVSKEEIIAVLPGREYFLNHPKN